MQIGRARESWQIHKALPFEFNNVNVQVTLFSLVKDSNELMLTNQLSFIIIFVFILFLFVLALLLSDNWSVEGVHSVLET